MNKIVKQRIATANQAIDLQVGDKVYETLFQTSRPLSQPIIRDLPIDKLHPFFTADIGFKPYPPEKLKAFAKQLAEEGQFERIIVRPIPHSDEFEILAGHNRTNAARLNHWKTVASEIIEADDDRATSIAISTNLLRRQDLSIVERGKAYKALLEAQRRQGYRSDLCTSGDNHQKLTGTTKEKADDENRNKYNARALVAEFFNVTEYEIRKAIKLTQLIPQLQDILESNPKRLNLACADLIADYDPDSQAAFVEMCTIEGYQLNKATLKYIIKKCPPPSASRNIVFEAWRDARTAAERRLTVPPRKITFDRSRFAPYLEYYGSERQLEELFLAFLQERMKAVTRGEMITK